MKKSKDFAFVILTPESLHCDICPFSENLCNLLTDNIEELSRLKYAKEVFGCCWENDVSIDSITESIILLRGKHPKAKDVRIFL